MLLQFIAAAGALRFVNLSSAEPFFGRFLSELSIFVFIRDEKVWRCFKCFSLARCFQVYNNEYKKLILSKHEDYLFRTFQFLDKRYIFRPFLDTVDILIIFHQI